MQYASEEHDKRFSKSDPECYENVVTGILPWQFIHRNLGISNIWVRCTVHKETQRVRQHIPYGVKLKRSGHKSCMFISACWLLPFVL